jgi:hypothetical protein
VSRARAAGLGLVAALALGACGVKAPPRPSGAPDKEPPHSLFKPAEDPNRPSLDAPATPEEPTR